MYFGLYASMGNVIDRPISVWEDMFLPIRLEEGLRNVSRDDGSRLPLVKSEELLVSAKRAASRSEPPRWAPRMLAFGVLIGAGLALLGRWATQSRAARVLLGSSLALLATISGLLGCFFLFLWVGTNHEVAHHNENILQFSPVAFLVVGRAIRLARGAGDAAGLARFVAATALVSCVGAILKVLPWFSQDNWQIAALMVPVWLGCFAATAPEILRLGKSG